MYIICHGFTQRLINLKTKEKQNKNESKIRKAHMLNEICRKMKEWKNKFKQNRTKRCLSLSNAYNYTIEIIK